MDNFLDVYFWFTVYSEVIFESIVIDTDDFSYDYGQHVWLRYMYFEFEFWLEVYCFGMIFIKVTAI